MTRKSEVELDALKLLSSLNGDYEIPSSWKLVKPVIKVMSVVYFVFFAASVANGIIYISEDGFMTLYAGLFFSSIACLLLTGAVLVMAYGNLSILMCIQKEVRDRSLLINIGKKKLKTYGFVILVVNIMVAIVLISERSDFIIGYGASWFVCMIIGGITFSMSMSRYMTPAVVATLDKIRQVVSSGEPMSAK
ncbi:hypothetical protein [Klebsiella aerogenes]|uniref:hypothetical protein n=1 Tax=Klebsiella aerogenes TaxID=548 RepID=UPI0032DA84AD